MGLLMAAIGGALFGLIAYAISDMQSIGIIGALPGLALGGWFGWRHSDTATSALAELVAGIFVK